MATDPLPGKLGPSWANLEYKTIGFHGNWPVAG